MTRTRFGLVSVVAVTAAMVLTACSSSSESSESSAASSPSAPAEQSAEAPSDAPSAAAPSAAESSVAAAAECTPLSEFTTITPGVLTVLLTAYPPHGYVEDGMAKGVDGELIAKFAEINCLELDVKDADVAGIPDQIKTNRADVSGGDWWRSVDRQEVIDMSDPLYLDGMALITKDGATTLDQLMGRTVGDLQGNIWNKDMKKVLGGDYKLYRSADQTIKDLKNGRVEAAVSSTGAAASLLASGELEGFQVTALEPDDRVGASLKAPQAGFMTSKDNPELTAAINEAIAQFRADGTLEQLLTAYGFPVEIANTGEPYFS